MLPIQKTPMKKPSEITRQWFLVDATHIPLGRLASQIATILVGKNKPSFARDTDNGDCVVVINAEKVKLTGNKLENKFWSRHSGIPGGYKETAYGDLLETKPEFAIEKAVRGMLPKSPLGRHMREKLKVYAGATHPHAAQDPKPVEVRV